VMHAYMYVFHLGRFSRSLACVDPYFIPAPFIQKLTRRLTPAGIHSESGPRHAENSNAHSVRPPMEFRFQLDCFLPVFKYINVRVISRFFQQRVKEPFHSGKLLSSRSFAPFNSLVNEHERGWSPPRGSKPNSRVSLHPHSRPTPQFDSLAPQFNSHVGEHAGKSFIHSCYVSLRS
jgi:hypothetical protein